LARIRMYVPIYTRLAECAQLWAGIVWNMSNKEDAGKAWSTALHDRMRATFRDARDAAGMSAQDVADETARLGYPISRSAIARYEGGTKLGLDVSELLVLAAALKIPPVTLVFNGHPDEPVGVLPGKASPTVEAIGWFCGDTSLAKNAVAEPDAPLSAVLRLTRERAETQHALAGVHRKLGGDAEVRHRDARQRAAQGYMDEIAEIDTEITTLMEGSR
jgi:transcriptional regulator with XRE-family HTH domain